LTFDTPPLWARAPSTNIWVAFDTPHLGAKAPSRSIWFDL
jgi:hypothetical protein